MPRPLDDAYKLPHGHPFAGRTAYQCENENCEAIFYPDPEIGADPPCPHCHPEAYEEEPDAA